MEIDRNARGEQIGKLISGIPEGSFETLHQEMSPMLLGFYRRTFPDIPPEIAEELIQDVWIRVWAGAHKFGGERGTNGVSWMLGIAGNVARDYRRRRHIMKEDLVEDWSGTQVMDTGVESDPHLQTESTETGSRLNNFVEEVVQHPLRRAMIELHFAGGLKQVEAAKALGIDPNTAKNHLHHGLIALRHAAARQRLTIDDF